LGLVVSGFVIYLRRTPLRSASPAAVDAGKRAAPTASRA
jgi:hypothetical protein